MCYEQKTRRNPNRKCNLRSLAPHAAAECNFKSQEEEEEKSKWENSRYRPPLPQLFQWELHGHRAAAGTGERGQPTQFVAINHYVKRWRWHCCSIFTHEFEKIHIFIRFRCWAYFSHHSVQSVLQNHDVNGNGFCDVFADCPI